MRAGLIVVGIIIAALGIWIAIGKFTYKSTDTVAKLGPAEITATHDKGVPAALGYLGIVIGAGLILGGVLKK